MKAEAFEQFVMVAQPQRLGPAGRSCLVRPDEPIEARLIEDALSDPPPVQYIASPPTCERQHIRPKNQPLELYNLLGGSSVSGLEEG